MTETGPTDVQTDRPHLSVTVTNYNYANFVGRNIESILAQTYEDFELIVIDNVSTDRSLDVIRPYADRDPRVRLVAHEVNQGGLASFRESCELSRGRYRVQVDADDWVLAPDAFDRQVSMLDGHPAMTFVFGALTMSGDESEASIHRPFAGDRVLRGEEALDAVLGFSLGHSGMMLRLESYRACGGYPDGFKYYDDMLLAVRLCELGDVGYIDAPLYAGGQHSGNEHLGAQRGVVDAELLPIIDLALAGPLAARLDDPAGERRALVKRALVHHATFHIFSGRPRQGWTMYWESARRHPIETILQRRTVALAGRTLLGADMYRAATSRLKRIMSSGGPQC